MEQLSPERIFDTLTAFHRTAALKAAIELNLFSAIGQGATTPAALAKAVNADPKGVRVLADFLTVNGFLVKESGAYSLTPESSAFLDRSSKMYLGGCVEFLLHPMMTSAYADLAETVRRGGTILDGQGSVNPDNPAWEDFARGMMPMMFPAAQFMSGMLAGSGPLKVLDIAAGHGIFGISIAQANPEAHVVAVDWKGVLKVAEANAAAMGVADRVTMQPGDAFDSDLGSGYDLALVTNFLHHFDIATNEKMLRRLHSALKPGGRVAILEFVPSEDRVSPPGPASFAMVMLASTRSGDAYTQSEYTKMVTAAGFEAPEFHPIPGLPETLVLASRV